MVSVLTKIIVTIMSASWKCVQKGLTFVSCADVPIPTGIGIDSLQCHGLCHTNAMNGNLCLHTCCKLYEICSKCILWEGNMTSVITAPRQLLF